MHSCTCHSVTPVQSPSMCRFTALSPQLHWERRRLQQLGPAAEDLCKDSEQRTLVPRPNLEIQTRYFPVDFWSQNDSAMNSCKLSLKFLLFLFWIHFSSQTFTSKSFTSGTLCCGVRIGGTTWGVVDPRLFTASSWLQFHDAFDVCVHRQPTEKYHEALGMFSNRAKETELWR